MVTVRNIAEAAGVSPMTVSRVVNGQGNVGAEMREKVLTAIQELGYVQNASASRLRTARPKSLTAGLILRDIANPFSAELHRGIEDELRKSSSLVLTASNDDELERTEYLVQVMRQYRVDGLIIAPPPGEQNYLTELLDRGVPVVLVDRPAGRVGVPFVASDGFEGVRKAVDHLAARGHRRIAFLGDELSIPMTNRRDGFIAGISQAGIGIDEASLCLTASEAEDSEIAVIKLLSSANPPTAFISARNRLAVGTIRALHSLRRSHDVAHIGFDDLELAAELEPGLTVITQNPTLMGQTAGRILVDMIREPKRPVESVVYQTRMITRGSGEILPSPDQT